jgi:hypothetical protein
MEESSTYQYILHEGEARGARETLLRQGATKFGSPAPEGARAAIEGVTDLERLWRLADRVLVVNTWEDLLAE